MGVGGASHDDVIRAAPLPGDRTPPPPPPPVLTTASARASSSLLVQPRPSGAAVRGAGGGEGGGGVGDARMRSSSPWMALCKMGVCCMAAVSVALPRPCSLFLESVVMRSTRLPPLVSDPDESAERGRCWRIPPPPPQPPPPGLAPSPPGRLRRPRPQLPCGERRRAAADWPSGAAMRSWPGAAAARRRLGLMLRIQGLGCQAKSVGCWVRSVGCRV